MYTGGEPDCPLPLLFAGPLPRSTRCPFPPLSPAPRRSRPGISEKFRRRRQMLLALRIFFFFRGAGFEVTFQFAEMAVGQNQCHFGVGAPPFKSILVGIGMFTGDMTHGQMNEYVCFLLCHLLALMGIYHYLTYGCCSFQGFQQMKVA